MGSPCTQVPRSQTHWGVQRTGRAPPAHPQPSKASSRRDPAYDWFRSRVWASLSSTRAPLTSSFSARNDQPPRGAVRPWDEKGLDEISDPIDNNAVRKIVFAFCLVMILKSAPPAFAMSMDVPCQREVEKDLQVLNLGSFDHPSSCTNKKSQPNGGYKFSSHHCASPTVEYASANGLVTTKVMSKDAEGQSILRVIEYDTDCKVKKISLKEERKPALVLDRKICEGFFQQALESSRVGIDNPNAGIVSSCASHVFADLKANGDAGNTPSQKGVRGN